MDVPYLPPTPDPREANEVLQVADQILRDLQWKPTRFDPPRLEHLQIEGHPTMLVWVIGFEYTVFESEAAFLFLEAPSLSLVYVQTKHGYQNSRFDPSTT